MMDHVFVWRLEDVFALALCALFASILIPAWLFDKVSKYINRRKP
jgi:hypothetical protein